VPTSEQVLRPLRASRTPLLDLVGPTPYVRFQSALDSTVAHGWHYYWKSTHLPELRDDLIDVIAERRADSPLPRCAHHRWRSAVQPRNGIAGPYDPRPAGAEPHLA